MKKDLRQIKAVKKDMSVKAYCPNRSGNSLPIKQGDVKVKCKLFPPSSLFLITEQARERAALLIAAAW